MIDPWLAPDGRLPDAGAAPAPVIAADLTPDEPAEVPTPMPLRPMTASDILDGGISVIKVAPRIVFVIAATFVIPLELVSTWVNRDSLGDSGFAGAVSAAADSTSSTANLTGLSVVLLILSGLVLALVTGAIAHLVSSWYADRPVRTTEALTVALRCAPPLLFAWFLVHLAEAASAIALLVPLLFVMPLFMVVSPAIAIERLGPIAGLQRSWKLTRTRFASVLGAALLIALVDGALTIAFGLLGLAVNELPYGWIGAVAIQAGASLVTVPFVAGATTLMYLDLRIRSEGLDLELDIAEHFASAG